VPALKTQTFPRTKIVDILWRASTLLPEEELFIPAASKTQQSGLIRNLYSELKIMSEINPEAASTISITPAFRDNRFWARITNSTPPLSSIFIKNSESGEIQKDIIT